MNGTFFDKKQPNLQVPCQPAERHRQVRGEDGPGGGYRSPGVATLSCVEVPCVARAEWCCDPYYTTGKASFRSFVI